MAAKRALQKTKSDNVFGQRRKQPKMLRAGLYARISTIDQQTLPMQLRAMREYAARRGWTIALEVREVNSGAAKREAREKLLEAARRREIDLVLVWRLDRWGRSVTDLLATTPAGRAMAGLLAVFATFEREILQERTKAGLAHARQNGKRLGRPATAAIHAAEIRKLHRAGVSKIRNRPAVTNRPYLGSSHPGSEVMKRPKRDLSGKTALTTKLSSMRVRMNRR